MTAAEQIEPFEALARARRILEEGLALLDGASLEDEHIPVAIGRLVASLRAAPDPRELRAAVAPDDLARFDEAAEDVLRLNAVLTSAVVRDREALLAQLQTARASRRDLERRTIRSGESGTRCDVSG